MAAPSQAPARRMRSKSAKARLTTTKMDLDTAMLSHQPDFNKSKRAQSAMGNKNRAENSRFVLPRFQQADSLGTTHYEEEFERKKGEMAKVRPSSPTRRNNPHPSEEFMQWKVSTRVLGHGSLKPQTEDQMVVTGTQERFYGDYSGGNDGDMRTEVPITNVATIRFPGRPAPKQQSGFSGSTLSGTRIRLNTRTTTAKQKSRVIGATAKTDSTAELLEEWMKEGAREDEKAVVMNMLKTAATDDVRLKKALHSTLSSAAMPGVESWLQNASESERATVAQVFEALASKRQSRPDATAATARMPPIASSSHTVGAGSRTGHLRRASDPLPVAQINPPPMLYRHAMQRFSQTRQVSGAAVRAASRAPGSRPASGLRRSHSHHGADCSDCETNRMEGMLSRMEMEGKTEQPPITPMPAMLWHMYSKRDHTPNVFHPGATFSLPQKYRGTHFDLTPEWPTV